MGMKLELNTMIVTKGREKKIEENTFELVKMDYRLYPMEIPLEVRKEIKSEITGTGVIRKLEWKSDETIITYELISLSSPN